MTIRADFEIKTYTIRFEAGDNGTLSDGATTDDAFEYTVQHGDNCTAVSAVADDGYMFASWSGGRTGTENPLIVTSITSDMTVTANFAIPCIVRFEAAANGTLTDGITTADSLEYRVPYGSSSPSVTAEPDEGYSFAAWSGGDTSSKNPLVIQNVTSDTTLTANYERRICIVRFESGERGLLNDGTSTDSVLEYQVLYGDDCPAVTVTPSAEYYFASWAGDYTGTDNPCSIKNVTTDMVIRADIIKIYSVRFIALENGTLTDTSTTNKVLEYAVIEGNNCPEVTAISDTGYPQSLIPATR